MGPSVACKVSPSASREPMQCSGFGRELVAPASMRSSDGPGRCWSQPRVSGFAVDRSQQRAVLSADLCDVTSSMNLKIIRI